MASLAGSAGAGDFAKQKAERKAKEIQDAKNEKKKASKEAGERWAANKAKKSALKPGEEDQLEPESTGPTAEQLAARDTRGAAMGLGDEELYEKKMTKEEKKAAAAAARAAKKAAKEAKGGKKKKKGAAAEEEDGPAEEGEITAADAMARAAAASQGAAAEEQDLLEGGNIIVTYAQQKIKLQKNARDINVKEVSVTFFGKPLIEDTEVVLNYGNRYGFLGPNGSGKSTIMKALAARTIPIAENLDIFFLDHEYAATDKTCLSCVCEVNDETNKLEAEAEALNDMIATADDEAQGEIQDRLTTIYERLDELDAATAETRASAILHGLGFTNRMQQMTTREFSGGWRMRVSLARALFLAPEFLLLDEPTNHLDMEAVIWLEDYLAGWTKILFFVSHSQDFMNNVCTHIVRLDREYKKLRYYAGNYDMYVKLRRDQDNTQLRAYETEQREIAEIKEFVAKFGHGSVKMVRQAQSREKLLEKKLEAGLVLPPEIDQPLDFSFPDPGQLPVPVLQVQELSFGYPGCEPLYDNVEFGVDMSSRIALVGPNGAGKTTLVKLLCGELQPTEGSVRPHQHLRISRFTQHFEDVLNLEQTPMEYFQQLMGSKVGVDQVRNWLGRYGTTGDVQSQVMNQLSDGQKARVVFAKMAYDKPHLLMLDEPTNPLDMNAIDSLARAINSFVGGCILVSHDMRLISQVTEEIWMCDHKAVTKYTGDIMNFKMKMAKENKKGAGGSGPGSLTQHANG